MKIKKIISLCKANKCISLYDMTTQMLGDGLADYSVAIVKEAIGTMQK